ncbi:MAG: hypothetical protein AB7S26_36845 [Sandaracinaceae bacterium]
MKRATLVTAAALMLSACGSFHLNPVTPARPIPIANFEVGYSPEIPQDRVNLLERIHMRTEVAAALRASYPVGAGPNVRVTITQFISSRYGPTRMHMVAEVMTPNGVEATVEADATAVMGASRGQLIEHVSQDCVNQIAQQL